MNRDDERRRILLRRLLQGSARERQRRRRNLATILLFIMMTSMGFVAFPYGSIDTAYAAAGCGRGFDWPVQTKNPAILKKFDNPSKPWLAGHRGIDLQAASGTELMTPSSGTLLFAGQVAGKNVLTIDHGNGVSTTYEPAVATVPTGTTLRRGERFGRVEGHSDHCDGRCLHWGMRRGKQQYQDPVHAVRPQRIALKPVEDG
ncbi:M23 family metallopeptidase [Bifidobacterium vansinderenii]|uniref:Peptidase, M23 family n=1 Tax=Bifidobacterium vansinderenii TaxID=1984871 RepID=A0A229VUL1_9BIFI|nr:M23 family metallopeptidase [Bifidobacterium vansinderenii]OXM99296.1 peptidase, M23 family [Bifidobacterium vansinderenii]